MSTNHTFNNKELELLLKTVLQTRNILFDAIELNVDKKSVPRKGNYTNWKGKRGTFPLVENLNKTLALIRYHINSEETIQLYDAMTFFTGPALKK